MKYFKVFNNHNNYNNYILDENNTPNISFCNEQKHVHYSKRIVIPNYLKFKALEPGTFTLTIPAAVTSSHMTSVSYSIDNGKNWVTTQNDNTEIVITTPTINSDQNVLWKGIGSQTAMGQNDGQYSIFSATGNFEASGNIMSLLYGDDFEDKVTLTKTYCFCRLFYNNTNIITSPELPATTLAENCYREMFRACTYLTTAPELPATNLAARCYISMFYSCVSLVNGPSILPAMTLKQYCYYQMFYTCKSLETAPILPAITLVGNCYQSMFTTCIKLNYIKAMFTSTPATSNNTTGWVNGVSSNGTFVKNVEATWELSGRDGIPNGWTIQTASS